MIMGQFDRFDKNRDGTIDRGELALVVKAIDTSAQWNDERIARLLNAVDTNVDGKIDTDEFVQWLFGANVAAYNVEMEAKEAGEDGIPRKVIRLRGFTDRSRKSLLAALVPFGEVEQFHHVQSISTESIAIFENANEALEAYKAHLPEGDDNFEVTLKPDTPLYDAEASSDGLQVVLLTPAVVQVESEQPPEGFYEQLQGFLDAAVESGAMSSERAEEWKQKVAEATTQVFSVPAAAKLLRRLSLQVTFNEESQDSVCMWRRTMRLLIRSELNFAQPVNFGCFLTELRSFL